jgi:MSHA biogenesis protein MshG
MSVRYNYKAASRTGEVYEGFISAVGPEQVEDYLREKDLLPINIRVGSERKSLSMFGFLKGGDYEDLILFTNSLATMYRAGVPLLQALSTIRIGKMTGRFNYVLDQIRLKVHGGQALSEAMADYDDVFSRVYVASVAAGEESGRLDETLDELADMLERELELTRQIKSAMRYPLIVISAIVTAMFVLMAFVVPRFVSFYSSFRAELPLPTRILIGASNFFSDYWPLLLVLAVAAAIAFNRLLQNPAGKLWFDRQILRIPILGDLVIKGTVARFSLMFRILFKSGLPLVRSLSILTATIRNHALAEELKHLEDLFRKGRDLDLLDGHFEYLPNQALYMISIGFESGNLEKMLHEIGNHYAKRVLYVSRHLTTILEPILTAVLGFFVLILALAIFLPMWNLIKVIGG